MTTFNLSTAASTNITVVKAQPVNLERIVLNNIGTIAFIKIYNKATTPVLATDVPFMIVTCPANNSVSLDLTGIRLSAGFSIAVTNLAADTDATAVAVKQIKLSLGYNFSRGAPA